MMEYPGGNGFRRSRRPNRGFTPAFAMPDPTRVAPHELPAFLRKYRLTGGRIRKVRVLYPRPKEVAIEFHLSVREPLKNLGAEPQPVRLVLRLEGVDEFRLQMRPSMPKARIADARISHLKGLYFVSLDSLGLEPTETAQVFDYRASEVYAAGRELFWEEVPRGKPDGQGKVEG